MAYRCPWWLGYFLINPFRRRAQDPAAIAGPFVESGSVVLEIGPGMGFFTLDLAKLAGPAGKVVAVDVQRKMLDALTKRAAKAGLADRIDPRLAAADGMNVDDLAGTVDFVLAFAVVHELPDAGRFFEEAFRVLKPGGRLLLSEPKGHVSADAFAMTEAAATRAGFRAGDRPAIARGRSVVLTRP